MLAKSVITLALTVLAAASPIKQKRQYCNAGPRPTQLALPQPTIPTLPLNGGATELPSPSSNLTLKRIVLGHGIQNYTCTTTDPSALGTAAGALAVLYDATPLYPNTSPYSLSSLSTWAALPITAALDLVLPLTMSSDTSGCVSADHPGADAETPFPPTAQSIHIPALGATLPPAGRHYFSATGVPTFDLGDAGFLSASVLAKVPAPASASPGPDGQPAVPWLHLGAAAGGYSVGLTDVYRVSTVGGTSLACTGVGTLSVPYTAMYWFYG